MIFAANIAYFVSGASSLAQQTAQAGVSTFPLNYPTQNSASAARNIRSDDVLVLFMANGSTTGVPIGAQSGYTNLVNFGNTGNTLAPSIKVDYKKAAGGETSTLTVTIGGTNVAVTAQLIAVPDIDLYAFTDATATTKDETAGGIATCAQTSITPSHDDAILFSWAASSTSGQTATIDSSYTEIGDNAGAVRAGQSAYLIQTTAAASAPTVTFSGNAKHCGGMVAFRNAPPRNNALTMAA